MESRTFRSLKNSKVALIFYFINLVLQFFSRKVFLKFLGSELLGLNTTAQNLLGFLNLAELGVGTAVAYSLYRPLFYHDKETISEIVSVQGWLYRRIAFIVVIGSSILMCFFPAIFAKAKVSLWYAYGSFIVLLFSSLLGYFANFRQVLLSADQKEYKITITTQGVKVIKVIIQIIAISLFPNGYVWWMILEVMFAILTSILLNRTINKEYPWLNSKVNEGKNINKKYPEIILKTKQLFFHKIGSFVLTQTSSLIIYAYASLTMVAIYGNYMLIVSGLMVLVNSLLNGISAGVGNMVAEGNKLKIINFFWELTSLRFWMGATICFTFFMLGHPFISLWLGKEYIMPATSFSILTIITFIQLTRTNDTFLSAFGMFQDIWAPIAEAFLNIGLSILFGYLWGLSGILSGVLVSLLIIVCCWKPYFLFRSGFKECPSKYFFRFTKYILILTLVFFGCQEILDPIIQKYAITWFGWVICAISAILLYGVCSLIILWFTDIYSKLFVKRLVSIISGKH